MRVKPIVKVMNFHSLIRVDKARKKAEKYLSLEKEVADMIDVIANNRNFILDKKLWTVDETKPELVIYFGSDLGFCGNINFSVNQYIDKDKTSDKIIVGRKLRQRADNVILRIARDDFYTEYEKIFEILDDSIKNKTHSKIKLIYNHFHNTTNIETVEKTVFPLQIERGNKVYTDDFYVEGDASKILYDMFVTYINYEVRIAEVNSFASENIFRQNSTRESLNKIEELEEEEKTAENKEKTQKEFEKIIDNYTKTRGKAGAR